MKRTTQAKTLGVILGAAVMAVAPLVGAQAYTPTPETIYELPVQEPCLKGRGNCAIYPKSAQLPSGRLVMSFERSTVVPQSGSADGQTLPIYASDDGGDTWQLVSEVAAPAYLSSDPAYDRYVSNWTSPNLYVLPEDVGNITAGTLLLASVVSGDDYFYLENKAEDPNWVPDNDGDRSDMAIALFSSVDEGETWSVVNIIATGGWQGGSAGASGVNVAEANTFRQVDPLWEPYLMVHDGQLVAYYSDENDYLGFNPNTGVAIEDPDNDTAPDSRAQVLVHKTWDGVSAGWSAPVVDIPGRTFSWNGGTQIGGGRPGMTYVAPTTDGQWIITFEYFGGGANVRHKVSADPLRFFAVGDFDGNEITSLPVEDGSRTLSTGGSPVVAALPDGRIAFNAGGSANVWINHSGRSDGTWTEYQTTLGAGYSRTLQYVEGTGRILILQAVWGGPQSPATIRHADIDFGHSDGTYYRIENALTGQVIGTGNNTNDANIGNGDVPDVRLEDAGAAANPATQYWHLTGKPNNTVTLLNQSGGRAAGIWTGSATAGQRIGQWVDDTPTGLWNVIQLPGGHVRFQSTANPSLYLTGAAAGAPLTLQAARTDGSQDWRLVAQDRSGGSGC